MFYKDNRKNILLLESVIVKFVDHLLRLAGRKTSAGARAGEQLSSRALRVALERLNASTLPPPTLLELSKLTNLSPSHFCRAFKAETGMPPHRYHLAATMARARTLLEHSHDSIAAIGVLLGYRDPSYFSRCFARETGFSPSAWRERSKSRQDF